jgi:hypothetical protein
MEIVMGELTYFKDSDGRQHHMYRQSESMSCALASLFVIDNYIYLSCNAGGEPRIKAVSAVFPGSLQQSQNNDPNRIGKGTSLGNIDQTAAALGIRFTATDESLALPIVSYLSFDKSRLYDDRPALVAIYWREGFMNMSTVRGGHAVVAARFTSAGKVVILDPWEPSIHEIDAFNGRYRNNGFISKVWYTG